MSVPPIVVPAHNLARWVHTELGVTDGVMHWEVPRTLLGIVPLWRRRVAVPAAEIEDISVGRAARMTSLLVGAAVMVLPFVFGWGWWALLIVPAGLWISLVALGPRMEATTSANTRHRANVCFGHQIDADLYMAAVEDIAAEVRAGQLRQPV